MSASFQMSEQGSVDHSALVSAPQPFVPPPRWLRVVGLAVDWIVISMGAVLIALIFINVILHVFGKDLAWVTELGELMMVWVTFLGGVCAAQRGAHMTITEFLDKLQAQGRRRADACIQVICMLVLACLLFYGVKIVSASWENTLTTLEWSMAWQYLPLPIAAVLMLAFGIWDLLLIWRGLPREQRYPTESEH